jgi:hypothetical protein
MVGTCGRKRLARNSPVGRLIEDVARKMGGKGETNA